MSDGQAQAAQPEQPQIKINMVKVLDLGCGILHQLFIRQSQSKSKALLKDLKAGKKIDMGAIKLEANAESGEKPAMPTLKMPLSLELDYSEFKGPGFSHPVFVEALNAMLHQIVTAMRAKKDLNILTSQTGSMLVHRPGAVDVQGQLNVLVLALDPQPDGSLVMKLMFVDPDQYQFPNDES